MTKHQNLTLQRYTKDAIRKYKDRIASYDHMHTGLPGDKQATEGALAEAVTMLDWLINAKTEG